MHLVSCTILFFSIFAFTSVNAQSSPPPSSWPHIYPGMPSDDFSRKWQTYFRVTDKLPNVTWPLARNWAGNIPVQREGHPNDTLFFWAFESSAGSFTAESDKPWGIWLNGGPGASSLLGLLFENGPLQVSNDYSMFKNEYAWTNVADMVWIDQPVGVGFSTADSSGYVNDEGQVGADFMGFLENFVKVFPNLAHRPLYIMGESYGGAYIPYIAKAYFGMDEPPVKLAGIGIGDGAMSPVEVFMLLPVVSVLETYPQIIGYDTDVFEYFLKQSSLCGYNLTLQYPQREPLPTLTYIPGADPVSGPGALRTNRIKFTEQDFMREVQDRFGTKLTERDANLSKHERIRARKTWKRSLVGRANGTIDPWYGCDLFDEMVDYAVNYTFPWSLSNSSGGEFDYYDIPDALNPEVPMDASVFLNDPQTRTAIHAPTSKNWAPIIEYPFGNSYSNGDPSVKPSAFFDELAANATAHHVKIVIYSGNDDSLVPHRGSEVTIQNTTFGGIRGFTRKPETPWYNDHGEFAGIVHQERGWTYVLTVHAGHILPHDNPVSSLTLAREFIFGSNKTGLVTTSRSGSYSVIGGEDPALGKDYMPGQLGIYYGSATTASTYFFPAPTVEAWENFISTATPTPSPT